MIDGSMLLAGLWLIRSNAGDTDRRLIADTPSAAFRQIESPMNATSSPTAAPRSFPADIFDVLASPTGHVEMDGPAR